MDSPVHDQYHAPDLETVILEGLRSEGKDPDALSPDDLATVDSFHIRGRVSTEELAVLGDLHPGQHILDAGCGIGGTARYLAVTRECRVTGIDLTESYCQAATALSERVGLSDRVEFRQASAVDLPFAADHFDAVWTEHVQMNIPDKASFYGEMFRVLKPGGQFLFHDVLAGSGEDLHLPVPWANHASISHLIDPEDLRTRLESIGLTEVAWQERTRESADFFRAVVKRVETSGWMPAGLQLLMGDDALDKFRNLLRNLEDERVRVIQGVYRK